MKCGKIIIISIISVSIVLIVIFFFIWIFYYNRLPCEDNTNKEGCISKGCNESISILYNNMNLNADPCDDFYEFTCGNFVKNAQIPDDKSSVMMMELLNDEVLDQVRKILEEPIKKNEIKPFILAKILYSACMDESNLEFLGITTLDKILFKLGGWPVLQKSWNGANFNWMDLMIKMANIGFDTNCIINIDVDLDMKNNSKRILSVDQATIGLNRDFFIKGFKNEIVQAYFDYMIKVAVYLGADETFATDDLLDSLLFETQIANISLSIEERKDANKLYNPVTIKELQVEYPFIPWLEFTNNLLPTSVQVNESEIVLNLVPSYIENIEIILKNTSNRTIANYIIWNVIKASVPLLNQKLRIIQNEFNAKLTGNTKEKPRWKDCTNVIETSIGIPVAALYVRKYFDEESKGQMMEMVQDLQQEFKNTLKHLDWMDRKTKNSALQKIDSIHAFVAYPDELLDDKKIVEYYQNLTINGELYLESMLNLSLFIVNKNLNELREPFNKTKWTSHCHAYVINAFYSPYENSIELPAGILQGIFFSSDRPKYLNYGGIGFVIGHEMTHGFDNYGRQFDKNGNLVDWWEPSTNTAFIKKANCVIEQYGNYSMENMTLNGVTTQGENIADNGGIRTAYKAYMKWLETHDPEQKLFGVDFTQNQMFWINAGTLWCSKYRNEYLKLLLTTDAHSPGPFRVNGVMANQLEFAKDFNCAVGTKMNPERKCKVW